MQIVINISKEIYKIAKQGAWKWPADDVYDAIENGTVLPSGHGRLIDADLLSGQYGLDNATKYGNKDADQQRNSYDTMMMYEIADMIDNAPTVVEAEKEEEG